MEIKKLKNSLKLLDSKNLNITDYFINVLDHKFNTELLDNKKIKYEFIDAEENIELTKKLGVKQAPTLVVIKNNQQENIVNLSNIKKFLNE